MPPDRYDGLPLCNFDTNGGQKTLQHLKHEISTLMEIMDGNEDEVVSNIYSTSISKCKDSCARVNNI